MKLGLVIRAPKLLKLLGENITGVAVFPFILVRDKNPSIYLIEHERTHLKQQLRYNIAYPFLYYLSKTWRYRLELEAYRISFRYGRRAESCAGALSGPVYGNLVSYETALSDILAPTLTKRKL